MYGRNAPLYCTLTLIAMQGQQTETREGGVVVIVIIYEDQTTLARPDHPRTSGTYYPRQDDGLVP